VSLEATRPNLICTENAKIKQKNSVDSRLRKRDALRQKFECLLSEAGILDAFRIILNNAKSSDLLRSAPLLSGCISEEQKRKEYKRMKSREWAKKNKDKIRDKRLKWKENKYKEYYEKNKEKIKKNREKYRARHREKELAESRKRYQKNKEKRKEYGREYYRKNIDKAKLYYSNNRERILLNENMKNELKNRSKMSEDLKTAISVINTAIKQPPKADGLKT
jgi:hypothetical protein